jgi:GT2 family glycosyltransferase
MRSFNATQGGTKVSIVILTHNRAQLLNGLLTSLLKFDYKPLEIIVVDNASEDGTVSIVKKHLHEIKHIRLPKNIGASARNLGMKEAGGDIIVCLDDDIIDFDCDDLRRISQVFMNRPEIGALNFRILDHLTGQICNWVHYRPVEKYADKEFVTYVLTEGAVAFRKEALLVGGYYPESFFISHEGPDLAFRIIDAGYEVIYSNVVTVRHCHSKLGRIDWLNYYYDTRNQFLLAARNFSVGYSIAYLGRGLSSMLYYSVRDRQFLIFCRGLKDGIKGIKEALKDRRVLGKRALAVVKEVDRERPGLIELLRKGVLHRKVRL